MHIHLQKHTQAGAVVLAVIGQEVGWTRQVIDPSQYRRTQEQKKEKHAEIYTYS